MDIQSFSVQELLTAGYKAEIESERIYNDLSQMVKNNYLKYRLEFLAKEERMHQAFIKELYAREFPEMEIDIKMDTPVPLPEVKVEEGEILISEIFDQVMAAEKAASEFYLGLADMYEHDSALDSKLRYLSSMEMGHYKLIEAERDYLKKDEDYDVYWPMMHTGL
ncbi:MAG: ferritin family protein [Thermoplasmata archaeon]|nr:ferritin family protein [Thermoplasmata archaeon]